MERVAPSDWQSKTDEIQVCSLFLCIGRLPVNGRTLGGFASYGLGWLLVKYSEAEGVEVGISKTFDGKHPCDLCLSIAKNKQTEKKQNAQLDPAKIYLVAHAQRWTLQPPHYSWRLRTTIAPLVGSDSSPPVPPPQAA